MGLGGKIKKRGKIKNKAKGRNSKKNYLLVDAIFFFLGGEGDNKIHFIIYTPVSFSNLILTRFAFSGKYLR